MSAVAVDRKEWVAFQRAWVGYLRDNGQAEEAAQLERRIHIGLGVCPSCGGTEAWHRDDPTPECLSAAECGVEAIFDALTGSQPR